MVTFGSHPATDFIFSFSAADPGPPPDPVKISNKKDGYLWQWHWFHVSCSLITQSLDRLLVFGSTVMFQFLPLRIFTFICRNICISSENINKIVWNRLHFPVERFKSWWFVFTEWRVLTLISWCLTIIVSVLNYLTIRDHKNHDTCLTSVWISAKVLDFYWNIKSL